MARDTAKSKLGAFQAVSAAGDPSETEERLLAIASHSADMIVEVDDQGCFLFASHRAVDVLGLDPEKLLGQPMRGFDVHPDERNDGFFGDFLASVGRGETTARYEARIRDRSGDWRWFESHFSAYRAPDGRWRTIIISRDVTDRVAAELRLRESEERYRVLAEAAEEIVIETDVAGNVFFVSGAIQDLLGFPPQDFSADSASARIHPEDLPRVARTFQDAALRGQRSFSGPYRVRAGDESWHWMETEAIPFRREHDAPRVLMLVRDVTDRHDFEERIQQAQRLEGLGVLAGGIAHDFNNLLTPILGDASLALTDLSEDSPSFAALKRIQRAARRAATLTQQMLAYAGKGPLEFEPLDVSKLMQEMMQLLESTVGRKARLQAELSPRLPAVEGDATQICQVAMNLIANAGEAVEDHGENIWIRTGMLDAAPDLEGAWQGTRLPDGPVVYFEVEDDGCGMDDETRNRIFDPFFTTKFTGRGLGLAAALGIVRGHGGALEIDTAPGRGTRFRVLLPASQQVAPTPAQPRARPRDWRGTGTVLVIDDDEGVRDLVQETFRRVNFRVVCAETGEAGLEAFSALADDVQLVVLDRTMPTHDGREILASLREVAPRVPVLVISGYTDAGGPDSVEVAPATDFLPKPFLPDDLIQKARELMDL